jgi:hypothetical protein
MKVNELIDALKEFDGDLDVCVFSYRNGEFDYFVPYRIVKHHFDFGQPNANLNRDCVEILVGR